MAHRAWTQIGHWEKQLLLNIQREFNSGSNFCISKENFKLENWNYSLIFSPHSLILTFLSSADPWPPCKQAVLSQRWVTVSVTDVAHLQPDVVINSLIWFIIFWYFPPSYCKSSFHDTLPNRFHESFSLFKLLHVRRFLKGYLPRLLLSNVLSLPPSALHVLPKHVSIKAMFLIWCQAEFLRENIAKACALHMMWFDAWH